MLKEGRDIYVTGSRLFTIKPGTIKEIKEDGIVVCRDEDCSFFPFAKMTGITISSDEKVVHLPATMKDLMEEEPQDSA